MKEKVNDLLWIIEQSVEELDYYLSDVTKEQFKIDVKALAKKCSDKQVVKDAIKKLEELL